MKYVNRHGNNATKMGSNQKHCPCVSCVCVLGVGCRIYKKPTWISFGLAFPYNIRVCWPTVINEATSATAHTHTHRYYKQKLYSYCGTYFGRISKHCVIQLYDE